MENLLLVFIKNPVKGNVKTRLAATLGEKKALAVYKKLLCHTLEIVKPVQPDKWLYYSHLIPDGDQWDDTLFEKKLQTGNDLGQRMKNAFDEAFQAGYEKVVIIGSDCAQLQTRHLEEAFQQLNDHEAVIGPSKDGGYYLAGMNRFIPELFDNKPWGTSQVFQQTIAECEENGINYVLLEELNDVDTEEDWNEVKDAF